MGAAGFGGAAVTAAAPAAGAGASRLSARVYRAYVAALLFTEISLLVIIAKFVPRILVGDDAEALSVWAVAGAAGAGFLAARWLGTRVDGGRWRVLLGLFATFVVLQIIGRADLSESATVWDLSWIIDLGTPSSDAFQRDPAMGGALDELLAALTLIPIWFRGVYLGSADLDDRSFSPYAIGGFLSLVLLLLLGGDADLESEVRAAAVVWAAAGVLTIALRHASDPSALRDGTGVQAGMSLLATLLALVAGIAIALLLVTGLVAAVAGSGAVEPVLDGLGFLLRNLIAGFSYLLWPLFWIVERLSEVIDPPAPAPIEVLDAGVGRELDPSDGPVEPADPTAGIIAARVFGGIAAVIAFTVLAVWLFRRFFARESDADELRESMWEDADLLGDLKGALAGLRGRFRRGEPPQQPDAPIAALYYAVLEDAAERGAARPAARTPLQFAESLERAYGSRLPGDISRAFAEFRYAGRAPSASAMSSLEARWAELLNR